ncbi:unnamed protein product, partial [Diplocarpon coronariae]
PAAGRNWEGLSRCLQARLGL